VRLYSYVSARVSLGVTEFKSEPELQSIPHPQLRTNIYLFLGDFSEDISVLDAECLACV